MEEQDELRSKRKDGASRSQWDGWNRMSLLVVKVVALQLCHVSFKGRDVFL